MKHLGVPGDEELHEHMRHYTKVKQQMRDVLSENGFSFREIRDKSLEELREMIHKAGIFYKEPKL